MTARQFFVMAAAPCFMLAACIPAGLSERVAMESPERYATIDSIPELVARSASDIPVLTGTVAAALRHVRAGTRERSLAVEFVPLLHSAPVGLRYRALRSSRALMLGYPAARCPAMAAEGGATLAEAVASTFAACRRQLRDAQADAECGCQIVAADEVLLAPPERFAYARGLPVRVLRKGRLDPLTYIASPVVVEHRPATLIRAGSQPVWRIEEEAVVPLGPDGRTSGPPLPARRRPLGLDRGRVVERVEAGDLTFLVGF
ncbi:MAG: hypothetical protein D6754_09290 [Alphaproteobacteria bacterium]|nr:MAG: hypothetical protein D6754_09290 [Alphaproteobacteria bacterium]